MSEIIKGRKTLLYTYFRDVSDLHAEGILFLRQFKMVEAIACFLHGLDVLAACCSQETSFCDTSQGASIKVPNDISLTLDDREYEGRLLYSIALDPRHDFSHYNDVFILFPRALYLLPEAVAFLGDDQENNNDVEFCRNLMSAVLLYNIALAHHLDGLQHCSSKELNQGLNFYGMAYSALSRSSRCLTVMRCHTVNFAFMTVVNNMGHIYAYFRSFVNAQQLGDELSIRFPQMVSQMQYLSDSEYQIFLLNVCFGKGTHLLPAPVA